VSYAALSDVQARAGALQNAWGAATKPSTAQITQFTVDVAAEIDALLVARGATPPAPATPGALALVNMNADGALLLALEATFPEGAGPSSASTLIESVRDRWNEARDELIGGTLPALALLESSSSAPSASSFWQTEPEFGTLTTADVRDTNAFTSAGPVGRGERF